MVNDATSSDPPSHAVITGGSSGIGLALAHLLAAEGHAITILARDETRLEDARKALTTSCPGARVHTISVDVADAEACRGAVEQAVSLFGVPGWAIASAGIVEPGSFLQQDLSVHERQMRTNFFGSLHLAHAVVPYMKEAGSGHLVFIASGASLFGIYGYAAYAPSKFAVRGLAETLRVELAPLGITVSLAYPPDTDTPQYAGEVLSRLPATSAITASGGLWQADEVAHRILRAVKRGRFTVTPGWRLSLLGRCHSVLGPLLRSYQSWVVRRTNNRETTERQ